MSRDEQIGFHKGSINTLVAERNELVRLVQVTESFIEAHIKALDEFGVKLERKEEKK